jgi:hypothetical protein
MDKLKIRRQNVMNLKEFEVGLRFYFKIFEVIKPTLIISVRILTVKFIIYLKLNIIILT